MTEEPLPGIDDYAAMLDRFRTKPPADDDEFLPPAPARAPSRRTKKADAIPMTELGSEICARLKEIFYAYNNRSAEDNRSAQETLGPSEIGTPCDRRISLSLMRVPGCNPGGDGYAAFRGTAVHASLAEMFMWADAGTGRFAVEQLLTFPSAHVPKGTGDLLDRVLLAFLDHKVMGDWSLNKLKTEGPSPQYRVQVHTYAYGARLKGEDVEHVAIIGWPSDKSSLDNLYVWTERYDPQVARDALARVERIAEQIKGFMPHDFDPLNAAKTFPIDNSDCKFCPWHAPGDSKFERGCNGRQ